MRILLLTDGIYPYVMGGMQQHSYNFARYLAKQGVEVHVMHCVRGGEIPPHQGADPTYFEPEVLKNLRFTCLRFPVTDRFPGHYLRENKRYSELMLATIQSEALPYDLVYAQGFTAWAFLEARKQGAFATPIAVNFHGYEMFQLAPSWKVKLQHLLLRDTTQRHCLQADYVLSFGGVITEILQKIGVAKSKIIELPIGIDKHWLDLAAHDKRDQQARRFVFVGRYERRKGIEELSAVIRTLLAKQKLDFSFHFIGPIPEALQMSDPKVTYHGLVKDKTLLKQLLQASDVLVCPSYAEGMPTVILEAMASGLAIVASRVGATPQQVQGNGYLIPPADSDALEKAIVDMIQLSSDQLENFKQQSKKMIAERFVWEKVIQQNLEAFIQVLPHSKTTNHENSFSI